jgi:hypothetical protein
VKSGHCIGFVWCSGVSVECVQDEKILCWFGSVCRSSVMMERAKGKWLRFFKSGRGCDLCSHGSNFFGPWQHESGLTYFTARQVTMTALISNLFLLRTGNRQNPARTLHVKAPDLYAIFLYLIRV